MLYKLLGLSWLSYVRPLSRTKAIMEIKVHVGHEDEKEDTLSDSWVVNSTLVAPNAD